MPSEPIKFVPLADVSPPVWRKPTSSAFAQQISQIPLSDSELLLTSSRLPIAIDCLSDRPRVVGIIDARFQRSPAIGANGHWQRSYLPLALRCLPFRLASGKTDDSAIEMAVNLTHKDEPGIPLFSDNGALGTEVKNTIALLRRLEEGKKQLSDAASQLLIAGVLTPIRLGRQVVADTGRSFTVSRELFNALSGPRVALLTKDSFLPIDLATACIFSQRHLATLVSVKPPGVGSGRHVRCCRTIAGRIHQPAATQRADRRSRPVLLRSIPRFWPGIMTQPADILFIHNNFPGQFRQLAGWLVTQPKYKVFAIGSDTAKAMPGVTLQRYTNSSEGLDLVHPYARRFEMECRRAEQIIYAANVLRLAGMSPKTIFVHPGWGEAIPLRQLFPQARICLYCEFFYRTVGADVGFDPEIGQFGIDGLTRISLRNASTLLGLAEADVCIAPTHWQRDQFPKEFQSKIRVVHDGIDTDTLKPARASFTHPKLPSPLKNGDEVLTFVARNLEPYRGFHIFMRALPAILKARPTAEVCVVGGTGVSYGAPPAAGGTWKDALLAEIGSNADLSRVHFLGALPYEKYLSLLRVSRAHTYLTYPFVLSWSLMEALAMECLVIASDTAPVREVINHGENGMLVPFFDIDALSDRLIDALAEPDKYLSMQKQARDTILHKYSFKNNSLPVFREILGEDGTVSSKPTRRNLKPGRSLRPSPELRTRHAALQTS